MIEGIISQFTASYEQRHTNAQALKEEGRLFMEPAQNNVIKKTCYRFSCFRRSLNKVDPLVKTIFRDNKIPRRKQRGILMDQQHFLLRRKRRGINPKVI